MSIATFESPVAESQLFFSWLENENADLDDIQSDNNPQPAILRLTAKAAPSSKPAAVQKASPIPGPDLHPTSNGLPARATHPRLAKPVRLGAVMFQLLRSYGVTDEEIAQGLAAYAAKAGLSQAG